jgi:hypothetical protein
MFILLSAEVVAYDYTRFKLKRPFSNSYIFLPPFLERDIPSLARFREFLSLAFGRHLQHLDDESRLVFYPLRIAPEGLVEKTPDVGLKLLPSLIRCLLTHAHYPPFP